jgi:hypothetical protein
MPSHTRVLQASSWQTTAVPGRQVPAESQESLLVQGLPSSQALPLLAVMVQVAVPLQVRAVQTSLVQVTGRPPPQAPLASQTSP